MSSVPDSSKLPNDVGPPGITYHSYFVKDTTLLKPVPFIDMDKDNREIILNGLELINQDKMRDPEVYKHVVERCKLNGGNPGSRGILAGRGVFQVISVSISHTTNPSYEDFEIYGDISITSDSDSKSYPIYERQYDDPETVSPNHEELSLCDCPIAPFMKVNVSFNLATTNGLSFKASKQVDWSFKNHCEDEDELPLYFDNGYYAMVIYTIIPNAIIGKVAIALYGPPKPEKDKEKLKETIHVEGEIIISNVPVLEKNEFSLTKSDKFISVYRVEQSRTAFAVAAYSWLCAEFSLKTGETEYATGTIGKSPALALDMSSSTSLQCNDKKYFSMDVRWILPDEFFGLLPQPAAVTSSNHYVEVFSIFVGCHTSTLRAISGTILVRNPKETVYIFSRKTGHPDKLSSDKRTLSLVWPDERWILDEDFYMHLKLKDGEGNDICWGNLEWSRYDGLIYHQRFDRRMCAVIPGENDGTYFATVHYSIFRNALRAKVTVTVDCKGVPCDFMDVSGTIYAEYDNLDYSSAYDQEYYRIIILDRPWEYRAMVKNNCSEIPLSKSLLTAPSDCQELLVSVDVTVCPFKQSSRTYYDRLSAHGPLRFVASKHESHQLLRLPIMGDCQGRPPGFVSVRVEWFDCSHGPRVSGE